MNIEKLMLRFDGLGFSSTRIDDRSCRITIQTQDGGPIFERTQIVTVTSLKSQNKFELSSSYALPSQFDEKQLDDIRKNGTVEIRDGAVILANVLDDDVADSDLKSAVFSIANDADSREISVAGDSTGESDMH